jgi:hypothetical protein
MQAAAIAKRRRHATAGKRPHAMATRLAQTRLKDGVTLGKRMVFIAIEVMKRIPGMQYLLLILAADRSFIEGNIRRLESRQAGRSL